MFLDGTFFFYETKVTDRIDHFWHCSLVCRKKVINRKPVETHCNASEAPYSIRDPRLEHSVKSRQGVCPAPFTLRTSSLPCSGLRHRPCTAHSASGRCCDPLRRESCKSPIMTWEGSCREAFQLNFREEKCATAAVRKFFRRRLMILYL